MLLTAIFSGLRASELRGLRWQDVDLKAGEVAAMRLGSASRLRRRACQSCSAARSGSMRLRCLIVVRSIPVPLSMMVHTVLRPSVVSSAMRSKGSGWGGVRNR